MTEPEACEVLRELLVELPGPVRELVDGLPILFLERPGEAELELGVAPDWRGAYLEVEGDEDETPLRVICVFLAACPDAGAVRQTLLHEIGHALGLDEEAVDALGLGVSRWS